MTTLNCFTSDAACLRIATCLGYTTAQTHRRSLNNDEINGANRSETCLDAYIQCVCETVYLYFLVWETAHVAKWLSFEHSTSIADHIFVKDEHADSLPTVEDKLIDVGSDWYNNVAPFGAWAGWPGIDRDH